MPDSNLQTLISLTFDENPKVRREAAKSLSEIDDPAALFALLELSYDKDANVKKLAKDLLNKKKSQEHEVMSFAEIFSAPTKKEEAAAAASGETQDERKKKILLPIEQLFEKKLGKVRADAVRSRMMPTIEKIYNKVSNSSRSEAKDTGRSAIQEFLTSYLDAISGIDLLSSKKQAEPPQPAVQEKAEQPPETPVREEPASLEDTLDTVSSRRGDEKEAAEEITALEEERVEERDGNEEQLSRLPPSFLKRAYETMMLTGGNEDMMKKEMDRMLKDVERDLRLAFTAAHQKYKETNITHLTKLKPGMGLVNTDMLTVKSAENLSYSLKGKKEMKLCRILVNDNEGNEGVAYLMDRHSEWLKPGMTIKVLRGRVKSFDFSGETAIAIGAKGNIYIVL